jgi:transcriptional regulator with XRE-family HTH domain
MDICERLKVIRKDLGCRQDEMAEKLGVVYKTYQRYEQGKNLPTITFLIEIAKIGYNLNWLITGHGDRFTSPQMELDPLIKEIWDWVKEESEKDAKIRDWFEIEFQRKFPEFSDWIHNKKSRVPQVAIDKNSRKS